ncbi:MAG: hypothetical protein IJ679_04385 [Lachnospiraceae bacterium]|nr:hypothetical protein [Lachnospiraceae bacterium]
MKKSPLIIACLVITLIFGMMPTIPAKAASQVQVYETYASGIQKIAKNKRIFEIQTSEPFQTRLQGNDQYFPTEKTTIRMKLAKGCVYTKSGVTNFDDISTIDNFYEYSTYKETRDTINECRTSGDWDFGVLIYVKGNRIIRVDSRFS